ncbi:MAG: metallophosphoesterase [Planctomycetota bacterium]
MSITLLHISDLHIGVSDRDYALGVLDEILETADARGVDYLIFSGDVFDSMPDVEALRDPFRRAIQRARAEIFYLPGNHEELQAGQQRLETFDFGKAQLLHAKPSELVTSSSSERPLEILAVPHQSDYSGYRDWRIPAKRAPFRVAMAHGTVTGMTYAGPDTEKGGGALDPDLFERFEVDYAALGHVHNRPPELRRSGCLTAYAGSARVWRSGEFGERGGNLVTLGSAVSVEFVPFRRAGQYRLLRIPLDLDGGVRQGALADRVQEHDLVDVCLVGLVEDERRVREVADQIKQELAHRVRKVKIDTSEVTVLSGIAAEPSAAGFIDLWEARRPPDDDPEYELWLRVRAMGLELLRSRLEQRS